MYHYAVYSYDQPWERQFSSLPLPSFPGLPGLPGFPGPGSTGPSGFPGQPGLQSPQAPTLPPPAFVPQQAAATPFAVDPGGIRLCLFRNTFIWLSNGEGFWFYPVFVGPRSVAGFRWNGWSWMIFGIDTRRIVSFSCF
ncbi:collagen-like protein [Neobacillus muris]|uniref:collagen-like protein n=1 Tax=Neobacillus muris TaxID=2941334 RepID=UPI0020403D7D|nr:collagen-like protein [Neobacillus muris]